MTEQTLEQQFYASRDRVRSLVQQIEAEMVHAAQLRQDALQAYFSAKYPDKDIRISTYGGKREQLYEIELPPNFLLDNEDMDYVSRFKIIEEKVTWLNNLLP